MMMISLSLIKEVMKEIRIFPSHAYKVLHDKFTNKTPSHIKHIFGAHRKQYLCWFEPKENAQNQIIIFFHGGGWTVGSPEMMSSRAALLNKKGYAVVMPSHRKLPLNSYLQIRQDLMLILKKVAEIRNNKDWTHKKIILGGMSSGANLAALLLFDNSLLTNTGFKATDFVGAFLCAAPINLEGMTNSFILRSYAGKRTSATFKMASPINYLPASFSKPILLIHGTNDGLVKFQSTEDFVKKLIPISTGTIEFYVIPNGSHIDAVSWAYDNNEVRRTIFNWLYSLKNA